MCGRYSFFDTEALYERFDVERSSEQLEDRYNVAPSQSMPVIAGGEGPHIEILRWGITPPWAKGKTGKAVINARAETVTEKPLFKKLFSSSRCLIPARGWFEWKHSDEGKEPHYMSLQNNDIMSFAGLCNTDEYTILTTEAEGELADIHTRMPLVLNKQQEDLWLNPDVTEYAQLVPALSGPEVDRIVSREVSALVNNPHHDSFEILRKREAS